MRDAVPAVLDGQHRAATRLRSAGGRPGSARPGPVRLLLGTDRAGRPSADLARRRARRRRDLPGVLRAGRLRPRAVQASRHEDRGVRHPDHPDGPGNRHRQRAVQHVRGPRPGQLLLRSDAGRRLPGHPLRDRADAVLHGGHPARGHRGGRGGRSRPDAHLPAGRAADEPQLADHRRAVLVPVRVERLHVRAHPRHHRPRQAGHPRHLPVHRRARRRLGFGHGRLRPRRDPRGGPARPRPEVHRRRHQRRFRQVTTTLAAPRPPARATGAEGARTAVSSYGFPGPPPSVNPRLFAEVEA
ncbi:hypothetical protein SGPA1_21858 [Streptomyces misionensis JCM 4497]